MSTNQGFWLKDGIFLDSYDNMAQNYIADAENISASISAQNQKEIFLQIMKIMPPSVFFFIEIPLDDEEGYSLYYLDNCTSDVAIAIIKRYGDILFSDGLVRFGFGSHDSGDEVYMQSYQVLSVYCPDKKRLCEYEKIIAKAGAKKASSLMTLWDFIDEKNPAKLVTVEVNGETCYNIVENLTAEGMYLHGKVE